MDRERQSRLPCKSRTISVALFGVARLTAEIRFRFHFSPILTRQLNGCPM